jgi:Ca2+-binding RTX toxin-like protein
LSILVGTSASDEIVGTEAREIIVGLGGDDVLRGGGGGDLIYGVAGLNLIYGDDGSDALVGGADGGDGLDPDAVGKEYDPPIELTEQLYGGAGNDWIDGGAGEDSIFGDDGNDLLRSGPGHDYIVGGAGNDLIYGDAGLDQMYGGDGDDFIIDLLNAPNADHGEGLNGDAGNDLLIGSDSWNLLSGGSGADVIMGGGENDVMAGGDPIYETIGGVVTLVGGTLDGAVDRFVFNEGRRWPRRRPVGPARRRHRPGCCDRGEFHLPLAGVRQFDDHGTGGLFRRHGRCHDWPGSWSPVQRAPRRDCALWCG